MNKIVAGDCKLRFGSSCESIFVYLVLFPYYLSTSTGIIELFLGSTHKIITLAFYGVLVLFVVLRIKEIVHRITLSSLFYLGFIVFLLLLSMTFSKFPELQIEVMNNISLDCFLPFILACCVRDFSKTKLLLARYCILIPFLMAINVFLNPVAFFDGSYSQSNSYLMLVPSVLILDSLFDKFSIIKVASLFVSVFLLISFGARGPVFCLGLFSLIRLVLASDSRKKRVRRFFVLVLLLFCLLFFYQEIMDWLSIVFESAGLSIRTLKRIQEGSFFQDSGRFDFYRMAWKRITESPFVGTGLINDRIYLSEKLIIADSNMLGNYPHNIILEILMQYGLFFGLVLIIIGVSFVIKLFSKYSLKEEKLLLLDYISLGLFPLLVSGSYVDYKEFYVLIGLSIAAIESQKRCKKTEGMSVATQECK